MKYTEQALDPKEARCGDGINSEFELLKMHLETKPAGKIGEIYRDIIDADDGFVEKNADGSPSVG